MKFPGRKDSITHDWKDSNGIDVDLSRVFFESKAISFKCALIADNEAQFWLCHKAFLAEWAQPGTRDWTVTEFRKTFQVYYKDCSDFDRFTRIKVKGQNKVACKFTLNLIEAQPDINSSDIFIVDEEGRFLTT